MVNQITFTLPEDLADRVRQIAAQKAQPIEQVVLEHLRTLSSDLPTLPPDEQAELDALQHLSDDTLWTIAREQMPDTVQTRAHELMDKNSLDQISDEEYAELEKLVERADRLMLRKAEASSLLQKRGYAFTAHDFKAHDE